MGTPITCKLHKGIVYSGNTGDMLVEGSLDVVWDHRTGEPTDVVGFELFMYCDYDTMSFNTIIDSQGTSAVWLTVESLLGDTLINIAKEHCDHEPPTDGTIQEQIECQKGFDDFYPPMPRG